MAGKRPQIVSGQEPGDGLAEVEGRMARFLDYHARPKEPKHTPFPILILIAIVALAILIALALILGHFGLLPRDK
jgi:hypothetical protein